MTTCKHCRVEIVRVYPMRDDAWLHESGFENRVNYLYCIGQGTFAEPSTEGTQPAVPKAEPLDLVDCPICGGSEMERHIYDREVARFLEENRPAESSVPQAAQPECNAVHPANEDTYCRRKKGHSGNHSAPCFVAHPSGASSIDWSAAPVAQPMSQAEWEARGEPAPVAQPFTEPLEKGWLGTVLKEIRQTSDSFEVPAPVAQVDEKNAVDPYLEECVYCGKAKGAHFGLPDETDPCCYLGNPFGRRFRGSGKYSEPAVAQVDAGKYDFAKVRSQHFTEIAEEYEPAVAQTESRPIPAASDCIMDFPQAFAFIAATAADENIHHPKCSYRRARMLCDCSIVWAEYYKRQVASLTQRLQEQEAREAELEEILDGSLHKYGTAVIASEAREAELNVEVASLTYRNEIAVSAASEWSKRNSVLRQQNRGKNEKLVALQAELASLTQRLQASEACEAELKAEIAKHLEMIAWFNKRCDWYSGELKRHDDRMEALERSHKALLAAIKSVQDAAADICMTYNQEAHNPDCDCYFCVYDRASDAADLVIAAAEKL